MLLDMWIEDDIRHLRLQQPGGITIGAFDGVHLGHRALIEQLVTGAQRRGMQPLVVTFNPLPKQRLSPHTYRLLSTLPERLAHMEALGVAGVIVIPFDERFMQTPAQTFVDLLVEHLALAGLWIGPDFRMGKDRQGDVAFLREAGARAGFAVEVLQEIVRWEGKPVRSSRIRAALRAGNLREANGCLGYPYQLSGTVVHGDHRGHDLGFPTANLELPEARLLPANGVYICRAHLEATPPCAPARYNAITNVGTRPTFDHQSPSVEAHLLDFADNLYGRRLRLEFVKRLRPELKFPSAAALIDQMHRDEAEARAWLRHFADTGA
jgi:riboflavin kinase / FMN adenylyltransferase